MVNSSNDANILKPDEELINVNSENIEKINNVSLKHQAYNNNKSSVEIVSISEINNFIENKTKKLDEINNTDTDKYDKNKKIFRQMSSEALQKSVTKNSENGNLANQKNGRRFSLNFKVAKNFLKKQKSIDVQLKNTIASIKEETKTEIVGALKNVTKENTILQSQDNANS